MEITPTTTVRNVGERELIRLLSPYCARGGDVPGIVGIGDDCATLDLSTVPGPAAGPAADLVILTKDLLIQGTHFLVNTDTNFHWIGQKAAAANISDLAAAGAIPRALMIGLGVPQDFPVAHLLHLYAGMQAIASRDNVAIVGGDVTRAPALTISVTAAGQKPPTWARCGRGDARAGDYLYVTGELGDSRAGLELILHPERKALLSPEKASALVEAHFTPASRIAPATLVAKTHTRAAMIDISDGLWNEAQLLADASAVQMEIHVDAIPVSPGAAELCSHIGTEPIEFAISSGEEYELLLASPHPPKQFLQIFQEAGQPCPFVPIGRVREGSGISFLKNSAPVKLQNSVFQHFGG